MLPGGQMSKPSSRASHPAAMSTCRSCGAALSEGARRCARCAAPVHAEPLDKTRDERVITPAPPAHRWPIVLGAVLAGMVGAYFWLMPRPPIATVTRTHWLYTVLVRQRTLVHHEGANPPADALNRNCPQPPAGAAPSCSYDEVEWPVIQTLKTDGEGADVRWPSELARDPDRRLERHEHYEVVLRLGRHESVYTPHSYTDFKRFTSGAHWTVSRAKDGTLVPQAPAR